MEHELRSAQAIRNELAKFVHVPVIQLAGDSLWVVPGARIQRSANGYTLAIITGEDSDHQSVLCQEEHSVLDEAVRAAYLLYFGDMIDEAIENSMGFEPIWPQ